MSIGFAIFLTLLATTLVRVGIVLLKKSIAGFSEDQARGIRRPVAALLRSSRGLLGFGLQVLGFGLYLAALSEPSAPISILQPLRAFGILVMAFLSVVFLQERLGALEWLGVAAQLIGILLLGFSLPADGSQATVVALPRLLTFLAGLGVLGGLLVALLLFSPKQDHAAVCYGALAGILMGSAYLHMKVFFMVRLEGLGAMVALSVAVMLFGSLGGFAVLLWSFRSCRALIVTTINLVLNQVVVIVGGAVCLGEQLPQEPLRFWARVAGLTSILIGVVLLARFQEARAPSAAQQVKRAGSTSY